MRPYLPQSLTEHVSVAADSRGLAVLMVRISCLDWKVSMLTIDLAAIFYRHTV